jgi:hypothetical protein
MSILGSGTTSNTAPPAFLAHFWGTPKAETEYYAAFGKFIARYALAESGVHIAVRHFSGVSEEKARFIFGAMRLNDLAWMLRRFTDATKDFEEADTLLTQLEVISKERDKFVHRLVEYDRKLGFKVTNRLTVKSVSNEESDTFTAEDLKKMEDDCNVIFHRLGILCNKLENTHLTAGGPTLAETYAPWRYKPPSPARPAKARPDNRRSRKLRRRASRASPSPRNHTKSR